MAASHGLPPSAVGILTASVSIPDDVIFRDLDGEIIILNLASGVYFGLNAVGSRAWSALAESGSVPHAIEVLKSEFDVEDDVLHRDVIALITTLSDQGLIRITLGDCRSSDSPETPV